MNRLFHLAVSYATVVGYFLAVTWGPAWHDHHQNCCHTHESPGDQTTVHSHPHHCAYHHHHHDASGAESQAVCEKSSPSAPCPAPCRDDDCVVCQTLAHPPLTTPIIALVDAAEPVPDWVMLPCPEAVVSLPAAYDSRGPPLV